MRFAPRWVHGIRSAASRALPGGGAARLVGVLLLLAMPAAASRPSEPLAVPMAVVAGKDLAVGFRTLGAVAIDRARGEIHVTDLARHEVVTFDTDGTLLGSFVHRVTRPDGSTVDGTPAWLAVDRTGRMLIGDPQVPWVSVTDFRGSPLGRIELPGVERAAEDGAGAIAVGDDGSVFVASRGARGRVHVFDAEFRHLASWGVAGRDSGQLADITGLAVAPEGGVILTCATTELAVQTFDARGAFLGGWGVHDVGPGNFSLPAGVATTADGRVWVSDEIRQIVQVFDRSGTYLGMFGGLGQDPGAFQYPRALASDGRDLLVVAERAGNRFQVLRLP